MTNNQYALWAALIVAVFNFFMFGNLGAAILFAGAITYTSARILFWSIDKARARWPKKR